MTKYIETTPEAGKEFYLQFRGKGPVVMLNLLKYRAEADYTGLDALKPEEAISGKQAYQRYAKHTVPLLEQAGSRILFYGECGKFVIGPDGEQWDAAMLVEHQSVETFMAFSQDPNFLKTAGHRTAALEDSRLLPISQREITEWLTGV